MSKCDAQTNIPLLLASESPRRSMLLTDAGIAFETCAPRYDEPDTIEYHFSPTEFAESNAYFKARSVANDYPDHIILGADTVVAYEGRMFGKPADVDDARRILSTLSGVTQQVITGVTLLHPRGAHRMIRHDITHVTMRDMTESELDAYLASGEWQGKAGAYGIQGTADEFVTKIDGSFSNVVGLPVELVQKMLKNFAD